MKTIMIVDDEDKIRDVIASYLHKDGFHCLEAGTGADALDRLRKDAIDLIVLDLMLPDMSGEQVCQTIRSQSAVPILMLTAKIAEENKIHGLTIGADDYMTKPFDPRELAARVRAILRRTDDYRLPADRVSFRNGELVIDSAQNEVFRQSKKVNLTPSELKLLLVMARHPERRFTREELVEKVLGFDFEGDARAIDQHVKNLRQKIEPDPGKPTYIQTVYGTGYRFIGGA